MYSSTTTNRRPPPSSATSPTPPPSHHPPSTAPSLHQPLAPKPDSSLLARAPVSPSSTKLWNSMQQKLRDVEHSSSLFFGASHAAALEDLRNAQIALAHAWIQEEEVPAGGAGGVTGGEKNSQEGVKERLKSVEAKLEDVARAMGKVEKEAGGMWEDDESEESEAGSVLRKNVGEKDDGEGEEKKI